MADPLTIIGTAGAIANIIDALTKTIASVCDVRQAWKIADLTVLSFENQLNLLCFALCEVQKWAASKSDAQSHQLGMQVDSCVKCCRLLIGKIDEEVSQFEKTLSGELEMGAKLTLLFKTKDMEQIKRMIDQQTQALTLLLSACNINALEEQNKILHQPKLIRVFREMERDTASLIVHRDTDSIVTATSVSSSKWSLQFTFDKELLVTNVYERWIRKFAKPRTTNMRLHNDTMRDDLLESANGKMSSPNPPIQTEQNTATRINSAISEASPQQPLNLSERFDFLMRDAMNIELEPLNPSRIIGDLQQQAKESSKVDRNQKDDLRLGRREVKVAILGSKTRKQVFEEMMLEDNMHMRCYPEKQLCLFRPIILTTVLDCSRYLADALQFHQKIKESDPIRHCLKYILTYNQGVEPDITLSKEFATAMVQIMEHPATKTLMEAIDFILPANGK
ncbi:hypothetical protein BFJ69_g16815 [Fusarium oxysporum]|uniref:Fungal N-terminal domain-containing protein n=1 Tax=Fusarium oxysporum TaxID=5507 RepID=A0A420MA17_FUSOX|nr:hypothetical protein BFJ69_g16815 [Fusarium oxysporum]